MSIPKDGYYMAKVQLDTGGQCPHYVRVKDGKPYSQWGDELLPEACSELQEVDTTLMVHVWPEDAAMELEALRTANAGLVERVSGFERWNLDLLTALKDMLELVTVDLKEQGFGPHPSCKSAIKHAKSVVKKGKP